MTKIKVYEGKLATVRGLDGVTFVVFDEKGNPIMETILKLDKLGSLLFGNTEPCLYIPTGVDRIGKKIESKQQEIFLPLGQWEQREADIDAAVAPFEVDGWFANKRDLQNPRRFVRHENTAELVGAYYDVRFERFIEDPTEK